ncbi:esterase [Massilia sp. BSC265]|nr:esterase [Massilia sp. BSC265]
MLNVFLDAWASCLFPRPGNMVYCSAAPQHRTRRGASFISDHYHADTGSLPFKLFIPSSYAGEPTSLIVMLHGCGQDADDFAVGTGMNELAEHHGFLVAYPEQPCEANWNRCWNWFNGANHRRGQGEPRLLAGLTRKIMADYAVDKTRVYAAGLSSGGAMAVILGRTYPDIFTAVGCHSGLAHGSATDSAGAFTAMRDGAAMPALAQECMQHAGVPLIVFHGDMDTTVNIRNSATLVQQTIASYIMHELQQGQAVAVSEEKGERIGRVFTRRVHRGARGKIVAEQWTLHGSGHAWSGGSLRGSYTDSRGPAASEEILRFFKQA